MVNEQPQEGQIYISTYNKMPAMPKEKTSAISFNKNTSSELKFKDQNPTNGVNTAAEPSTVASNNRIHHPQNPRICGCGAASVEVNSGNSKPINGHMSTVPVVLIGAEAESPKRNAACSCGKLIHINDNDRGRILGGENYNHEKVTTNVHKLVSYVKPVKKSANDYIFRKYIGEGSFSIVYLAIDVQTKREYAIKVCEKRHILREHKQEYIRREREVMHIMTNVTGFVNLSCTFQDHRSLYFVMTYAKNGDLLPYINKVGSFDIDCTRHYAAELVLACEEMHRRNIVHRDLKPENILLDSNMHTLIADFGSAKILTPEDRLTSFSYDEGNEDNNGIVGEIDPSVHMRLQHRYNNKRRGSFVGTAQYVSPEVLQNGQITPATDLWALGCIVYQMISGLPPFRGSNDYVIFKEILACDVEFPQGFNEIAEDLVRCLLKIDPVKRLGALDGTERYNSIRSHPFFDGVDFDTIRQQTPPAIYPYLPGVLKDEDFRSSYRVPELMEPGLDDKQLTRLLGMELGTSVSNQSSPNDTMIDQRTISKNVFDISEKHKQQRLELQKADKWHVFTNNEVILKKGYINKRKGLFARKRMLLLTTGPHLIYIDPAQMIKKGEIPWNHELRVEAKNFKIFFVHTPNRTYYLEDPEGYSLEWVNAIENMHMLIYNDPAYVGSQLSASVKKPLSA